MDSVRESGGRVSILVAGVTGAITLTVIGLVYLQVVRAPKMLPPPRTETVCNGMYGCGAPEPMDIIPIVGILVVAVLISSPVKRVEPDDEE